MVEQVRALTLDEFMCQYDEDGPFEFIDGEMITLSATKSMHGVIMKRLMKPLWAYEDEANVGEFFSEMPFVILDQPDWVRGSRVPDIMFFRADRLEAWQEETPDWGDKPYTLVPDLAIEIVSPTDRYTDVQNKVETYLRDGVAVVWIVDPSRKTVTVYTESEHHALGGGNDLTAPDLLPGFELSIDALFAE